MDGGEIPKRTNGRGTVVGFEATYMGRRPILFSLTLVSGDNVRFLAARLTPPVYPYQKRTLLLGIIIDHLKTEFSWRLQSNLIFHRSEVEYLNPVDLRLDSPVLSDEPLVGVRAEQILLVPIILN